ncbi:MULTISPECIES: GTP-binding protein [Actinoplanes]|uniref:GTP-binding protein n=1 Tax=Actinoplanes TaxID=1865 RepID=UPI000698CEA5|nr:MULTISPECIES: GTP-binding protein [Actinoplanes]GLY02692.1 hypothetical protein Acsp01_30710 [Actinoplanes sp. NBRC 101535]
MRRSSAPLVVPLCGFWPHATRTAADRLAGPGSVVDFADRGGTPVAHLVNDLITVAGGSERDTVVVMPDGCEPDHLRRAWTSDMTGTAAPVTVVAADLLLDGLTADRPVSELVARQIEQAGTIVIQGGPESGEQWEADQLRTLLRRLAPWAGVLGLDDPRLPATVRRPAGRFGEPVAASTRGLLGRMVGVHEPVSRDDVVACVFKARRPFHPERLHRALPAIVEQVLRSRGHFWLAGQPDRVLSWESAGVLTVTPAGHWLDGQDDGAWEQAHPERRIAAALDWDPYYGDRHQHLAFVGVGTDPVRLHRTLARCLLTDAELSLGPDGWQRFPDTFAARGELLP